MTSLTLRSFIKNYKGLSSFEKWEIENDIDDTNPNLIEGLYRVYKKLKLMRGSIMSPLNQGNMVEIFKELTEALKNNNYKVTSEDVFALLGFSKDLNMKNKPQNYIAILLDRNGLIDDDFVSHLSSIALRHDKDLVDIIVLAFNLLKELDDIYYEKFMSKISPELFKDTNSTFHNILDLKHLGIDSDDIKKWRTKNIIPDYYNALVSGIKSYLTYTIINKKKNPRVKMYFFYSLSLLNEAEVKPYLKEIFDMFQAKNNEEIISIFWKIGEGFMGEKSEEDLNEILKVSDYLFPTLIDIYSITYADIISYINNYTIMKSKILNKLFFSILSNGIIPTKDELEFITKYYEDFLKDGLEKNFFKYDPELYTLSIKLNQGKIDHNDENYKKWVQDWYIPHSKLKDDDFFTFSEQEQACYLNEPEKFKVENTSLGSVSVDVLRYNINNLDGKDFMVIYKYINKKVLTPDEKDFITKKKKTININLKFTNSEIADYHPELRKIEAYKKYIEKQALFISSLSLYEYAIVFSHFSPIFSYSTMYIMKRGNIETSIPIYGHLLELIIKVCGENGIDIAVTDLISDHTTNLENVFLKLMKNKKDAVEIKDLALNISKKIMERYYIDFNEIFQKAPEVEDDLVLYRGVKDVYWNNNISKDKFSALTIQSTTLIPYMPGNPSDIIKNYTNSSTEKNTASCCLKRIVLKKGCRSIFIELLEPLKRVLNQVILPSYSVYTIKEVHDKLMVKDVSEKACNVQKDFIKTFDLEVIQTPTYPSVEDVVSKFSSHFKSWMYDANSHWIVKGGFGLKKVLEIRYNKKDAIKTDDIDISVLFTKNDEDEIKEYKDKLIKEFKDFVYSTGVPYLFSYIEPRYIGEKELKWICQFSYAGKEWIDISLVYSTWGQVEVDEVVSKEVGLPVKTIVGYAKDYKDILKEENIKGIDDRTYKKRNPKTGFLAMKGRKDIERTKELCFIDEVEKDFPTLCSYLRLNSVKDFMSLNDKELKDLLK